MSQFSHLLNGHDNISIYLIEWLWDLVGYQKSTNSWHTECAIWVLGNIIFLKMGLTGFFGAIVIHLYGKSWVFLSLVEILNFSWEKSPKRVFWSILPVPVKSIKSSVVSHICCKHKRNCATGMERKSIFCSDPTTTLIHGHLMWSSWASYYKHQHFRC